jgi:tol-pal system protein YbgF
MRSIVLSLAALALASCVATGTTSVQTDINSVKHASIQNRKDVAELREEIKALKGGGAGAQKDEVIEALRTSQTSLFTQVSDVTLEVQSMTSSIDEIRHETKTAVESIQAELDVIKGKSEDMKGSKKSLDEISARLAAVEGSLGILKTQIAALSGAAAVGAGAGRNTPDSMYHEAYALFEKKKYTASRKKFVEFVSEHPGHELAGNAIFWIGETHYGQKRYDSAILSYQDVIEKHPENRKVPASLLKQAYAFVNLGDKVAAKGILKTLIEKHPDSNVADQAKDKLKELK